MPSLAANGERDARPQSRAGTSTRSILVIYSFPRLWSMGPGSGSPDFTHSLMALARAGHATVVYPRADSERSSPTLMDQAPPGLKGIEFRDRRLPLLDASRGPRVVRLAVVALNLPLRMLNYLLFNLAAYGPARRAAAEQRPDLVTAHGTFGVWTASRIAARTKAPLLVRLFGVSLGMWGFNPFSLLLQFEEALALKVPAARWVIANDGSGGGAAARRMGAAPDRITMLRPAAGRSARDPVDRRQYRERLGLTPDTLVVVRVCRLWRQQRIERLIEALPRATRDGAPVAAVIIGDGPERERLERLATGLDRRVVFTGAVANDRLYEHYLAADLYAATGDRTNLGQSVLEAMCHGLPIVAIDSGETGDLIRDGINGRLVASADPAALQRALAELLDDKDTRLRLGREALRTAEREIADPDRRVAAEAEVLASLMNVRVERGSG